MPLVTDYHAVKEAYAQAAELGVGLPVFCCEDRETLEAILASALQMAEEIGVDDLPIIPAWTCRYPARGQMTLLTACGDPLLGTRMMFSDLQLFAGQDSPYRKLRIMPHLDHAFPWLDGDILEQFADSFASVMCDASEKPFDENIKITAQYVERISRRVVVEGAVDEIYEFGVNSARNEHTTAAQAQKYISQTGVDIIVPNVGTEHRATADQVKYDSQRAQEISNAVGTVLCLHGTSSVNPDELPRLPGDGFIRINVYTTLAVKGGQALTRQMLADLGNIFGRAELDRLVSQDVLGSAVLSEQYGQTEPPIKPKLARIANPPRRDAWFRAVRDRCHDFLVAFNYSSFSR